MYEGPAVAFEPQGPEGPWSGHVPLTPNPNIHTNSNPNSRYLSLFKNAGYETAGYEKVRYD